MNGHRLLAKCSEKIFFSFFLSSLIFFSLIDENEQKKKNVKCSWEQHRKWHPFEFYIRRQNTNIVLAYICKNVQKPTRPFLCKSVAIARGILPSFPCMNNTSEIIDIFEIIIDVKKIEATWKIKLSSQEYDRNRIEHNVVFRNNSSFRIMICLQYLKNIHTYIYIFY